MKFINDILDRVFANPKSSAAGMVALIVYLTSMYGFEVSPELLGGISALIIMLIGLLKRD